MTNTELLYDYEISIPDYWDRPLYRIVRAKSAGEAKYNYWLRFQDAYNIPFGDFLRYIKCRKVRI